MGGHGEFDINDVMWALDDGTETFNLVIWPRRRPSSFAEPRRRGLKIPRRSQWHDGIAHRLVFGGGGGAALMLPPHSYA